MTGRRRAQAVVIGDSAASARAVQLAESVGELLARLEIVVVTGGRGGVMEAANRGAARAGGLSIGIFPGGDMADANPWCDVVIPTGIGNARNAVTANAGDFAVAIGGAAGTLSEICFAALFERPVFVLAGAGGAGELVARMGFGRGAVPQVTPCSDLAALERSVAELCRRRGLRRP